MPEHQPGAFSSAPLHGRSPFSRRFGLSLSYSSHWRRSVDWTNRGPCRFSLTRVTHRPPQTQTSYNRVLYYQVCPKVLTPVSCRFPPGLFQDRSSFLIVVSLSEPCMNLRRGRHLRGAARLHAPSHSSRTTSRHSSARVRCRTGPVAPAEEGNYRLAPAR